MRISATLALVALTSLITTFASAQTFSDIYNFPSRAGNIPYSGVILDSAGNLYGTTSGGGQFHAGIVYELSFNGGVWTETTLYSFTGKSDGGAPQAGLAMDSAGNLYGTTTGINGNFGTVFELSPTGGGAWTFKLLHSFGMGNDGSGAPGNLIFDSQGMYPS